MAAMVIPALRRPYCFAPYLHIRRTVAVSGAAHRLLGEPAAEFEAVTLLRQKQATAQPACWLGIGVPQNAFCME